MRRDSIGLTLIAILASSLLWVLPAPAARIECITANTIDGSTSLSATAIRVKGRSQSYNIEVYSTADAEDAPSTCTVGGSITCAGWDSSGAAELWMRCDRNAPWLQMPNTSTYNTATNEERALFADCQIALKVTATGAGGNVCLYLAITGISDLDPDEEVQDGSTAGSWGVLVP